MGSRLRYFICFIAVIALLIASPQSAQGCREALDVCADLIIPSLFPFFILTGIITGVGIPQIIGKNLKPVSQRLFGVSGEGATALFMGLVGGYPMAALYIAELRKQDIIGKDEAERLMGFCSCSGFGFIIGAVGCGVFGSLRCGILLYLTHALGAVTVGILMKKALGELPFTSCEAEATDFENLSFGSLLSSSVRNAVISMLNVCGFVVLFSAVIKVLDAWGIVSLVLRYISELTGAELTWLRSLYCGIFELGCAFGEMRSLAPSSSSLTLAAFILGWGGLSVQLQCISAVHDAKIKGTLHYTGHLLLAVISAIYTYILTILF